ncbi:HRDC domain-containing protein [Mobilicoccus pelagius]|uniref:Ribonuclease D n=1 Tax=Mobilicoccus pelagius NBRC 104925 TaxID=1089455 RepID=H5UUK5_9MICO|nr:HRDC domain-containing protein [Mobilicoccus pelagius]GAB49413.1 ribonuclease D [Mobilicoccus pelagius NBRC 104925]
MSYLTDPFAVPEQPTPPAPRDRGTTADPDDHPREDDRDDRPREGARQDGSPDDHARGTADADEHPRDPRRQTPPARETGRARRSDTGVGERGAHAPGASVGPATGSTADAHTDAHTDDHSDGHADGHADGGSVPAAEEQEVAPPVVLTRPAEGVPGVVEDEHRLLEVADALAAGHGPLAIDAERASGYRYGQRAYLVQVRREGAGTWLFDPMACPDLEPVQRATRGVEWILHAATQDLGCLREVGLSPDALFDTELGARLAGLPRVGLAAVVEHYLGFSLAKEHSAVDWSTRPLPEDWLIYAALDVECLAEVREAMIEDLTAQGKIEWARQEFEALTSFTGHPVRTDPWRRVSGMRRLRTPRAAAILRELWYVRDDLARDRDTAPGRIAPDAVIGALAGAAPTTSAEVTAASSHRAVRRHPEIWARAVRRALDLPESELPPTSLPSSGPPAPRSWADRDPLAAARLTRAKDDLARFAEEHRIPLENVLTPDTLRRVVWNPPADPDEASLHAALRELGARPWQADIAAPVLDHAFATAEPA